MLSRTSCPVPYFLAVITLVALAAVNGRNGDNTAMLRHADYETAAVSLAGQATVASAAGRQRYASPSDEGLNESESLLSKAEDFRFFVTPEDQTVRALAARTSGPEDAYQTALQWIYVSDEKLHQAIDKWLTPREFLTNVPLYPTNPLPGQAAGDCEEQANTLVSIMRAQGVPPEEVRVVLGEVAFGSTGTGHAWVELSLKGQWTVLDPCLGAYWDDKAGEPVDRKGVPFQYYRRHVYPVIQVWTYYNDVYFLDVRSYSGNPPASWGAAASDAL